MESLKRKLEKDELLHQAENSRLMRDNAKLTAEVNNLRRELHSTRQFRGIVEEEERPEVGFYV